MVAIVLAGVIVAAVAPGLTAQEGGGGRRKVTGEDAERIERFLRSEMAAYRLPGLAYAVIRDGRVLHQGGLGSAGGGRPMTPHTPVQAASLAKSFTALAVMQQVEAGQLELRAPVRDYLPWFRTGSSGSPSPAESPWRGGSQIRVEHLLYQSSGLSEAGFPGAPADASMEEAVRALTSARPSDPPGEAFHYFNYNYTTLGLLIEELSGLSYPEYVEKGIFRPLGMGDSRMLPQRAADRGGELPEAEGHGNLFGFPYPVPTERSAHCGPSGGLVTTAGDLALYARAHLAGGNGSGGGAPLLSPDGFASLHRPGIGDREAGYAMGWITSLHRGRELLRHGGSLPGYRSFLWLLPEEELGIVVLLNQNGFLPAVLAYSSIPAGIADLMLGYEPDRPFPLRALYWGVSVLMLLLLGLHLRWWLRRRRRLRREPGGASRRRRRREAVMIAGELLLAGAVVLAVPRGAELLLDRGMSWQLGFTMAPAAMSLLAWPAVAAAGRALGRGSALFFPASD